MVLVFGLICVAIGFICGVAGERIVGRKENKIENDRYYVEGYRQGCSEGWGPEYARIFVRGQERSEVSAY
jgi:hypothetical protein